MTEQDTKAISTRGVGSRHGVSSGGIYRDDNEARASACQRELAA